MKLFKSHSLAIIYHFIFAVLIYGVIRTSGTVYLKELSIVYSCFLVTYCIGFYTLIKNQFDNTFKFKSINLNKWISILPIISIVLTLLHLLYLGDLHAISALKLKTITEVVQLRRSITAESNILVNYIASFNIKGLLPFTLLALLILKKKKLYWILFALGSFYVFCLMQKSFIIVLLAPAFIYSLLKLKWLYLIKYCTVITTVMFSLVLIQNPEISKSEAISEELVTTNSEAKNQKSNGKLKTIIIGLEKRILIVPGKTITGWFKHIPKDLPYQNGSGYRFAKFITQKEYSNYAKELYPLMYPTYAARGLQGNVNVASFMYDYANFGWKGFIISGISIGLLFVFIEWLFMDRFVLKLSINIIPVLLLSSQAITTALFSGGWGLMLLLYFLFRKKEGFNKG